MGPSTRPHLLRNHLAYKRVRIEVVRGPDAGVVLEAAGTLVRLGTAPDNDIVLTDDTVSRCHCEIQLNERGFRVRDVGSTNGVRIAAGRIHDASFEEPLEIRLGQTTLRITPLAATEEREQLSSDRFGELLGRSSKMRELFVQLARFAPTDMTILIEGETGTGKDVVAESIHGASARAGKPFVVFDCGAVAPQLVESELFGHVKGAFTGAVANHPGLFEQACGGTLFLDELGELLPELQPKLLRVLENRVVRRLGGSEPIPVDVRVIAATNRKLLSEVRSKKFREDLYYRLSTVKISVPPLRERMDDVPMLIEHFLRLEAPGCSLDSVPPSILALMQAHSWPGNVRELRSAVQRLVVAPELSLMPHDLARTTGSVSPSFERDGALVPLPQARRDAVDAFERAYLQAALQRAGGNATAAAALAQVSRTMVHKLMRKHALS